MESIPEHRSGPFWRVQVQIGPKEQREYVCATEQRARALLSQLGTRQQARLVPPTRGDEEPGARSRFRIQVSLSAKHQLKSVASHDWSVLLRRLIDFTRSIHGFAPPSREALEAAGIDPPYLRIRAGSYVLICDAEPQRRTVTLLHVLRALA